MKTLREMMDQLDEISRRDFLKGASAATVAAAGGAKGQTIGGGEDESKEEATRAAVEFYKMARKTNLAAAKMIEKTLNQRLMQFYNLGGQDIRAAANYSLTYAIQSVESSFQAAYAAAAKDKEESSLATAYLSKRLGLDQVSNDEQLKRIGSLERFNLMPLAEHFVKTYTQGLQAVFDHQKKQKQQPQQSNAPVQKETNPDGTTTYTYSDGSKLVRDQSGKTIKSSDTQGKWTTTTNEEQIEEASPEAVSKIDKLFNK